MIEKLIVTLVYSLSSCNANISCVAWFYQPKLPDKVKKLKKTKKGV